MLYDLIVVGGGAAGMMAAITAAESGKKVIIIEKMNRLGKKILATGNGRCNFTNSYLDDNCYRGSQHHFPYLALEQFGYEETVAFFHRLGIAVTDKNGYYYPRSNQAATIADGLIYKINSLPIKVQLECKIKRIEYQSGIFLAVSDQKEFRSRNLLLATGGQAQKKLGSDGSGFLLAKQCGHKIINPFPALTSLKIKQHPLKEASGVRCPCQITALLDHRVMARESGELQITKYGVSGVAIFQLSRYLIEGMQKGKKAVLELDFLSEETNENVFFETIIKECGYKTIRQCLEGIEPSKLAAVLLKRIGIASEKKVGQLTLKERKAIWKELKHCQLCVSGWSDFEFAQVTAGGVSVEGISPYTMESEKIPGLYFAGEILDVDGTCGGYNLQWAWTCGYLAGRSVQ